MRARRPERCRTRGFSAACRCGGQASVQRPDRQADGGIEHEHAAQRIDARQPGVRGKPVRQAGGQRANRGRQRAGQAVAREHGGAFVARGADAGKPRVLERQEHADIAGTGVERADEGDHQQRPERAEAGEADAGGGHQQRRAEQQRARRRAVAPGADRQRGQRRSRERGGAEHADGELAVAQRQQVRRQQHRHRAIDEAAQRAGGDQRAGGGGVRGVQRQ